MTAIDETRCRKRVYDSSHFSGHQCKLKVVKDGFCRLHHPDSVKARGEAAHQRYLESVKNSTWMQLKRANEEIDRLKKIIEDAGLTLEGLDGECD